MKTLAVIEFNKGAPPKATFSGIDWGRKDRMGLVCPRCHTPHQWRKREPKACRHCGIKFMFTANIANQQLGKET